MFDDETILPVIITGDVGCVAFQTASNLLHVVDILILINITAVEC